MVWEMVTAIEKLCHESGFLQEEEKSEGEGFMLFSIISDAVM